MNIFKLRIEIVIAILIVGLTKSFAAYIHPQPGCWALEADFLYLYPSIDDTYFVINSQNSSTAIPYGERVPNTLGFNPAFRIGGYYGLCNPGQDVKLSWTYLHANSFEKILGGRLFPTAAIPPSSGIAASFTGQATNDLDIIYQNVEWLFEQKIWDRCFCECYFQYGLQYTYLRFQESIEYDSSTSTAFEFLNYKGRIFAGGPEMGLESCWFLCSCDKAIPGNLSLIAGSSIAFLVANSQTKLTDRVSSTNGLYFLNDQSIWKVVPAWHCIVGLNYLTCWKRWPLIVEIGYDFTYFNKALSQIRCVDDAEPINSFNNDQSFSLQGPYASVSMSY